MRTLVFSQEPGKLSYSYFLEHQFTPSAWGAYEDFDGSDPDNVHDTLRQIAASPTLSTSPPELIAVRVAFGGELFKSPAVLTEVVLQQLETLAPQAPLHLPPVLVLLRGCREVFKSVPILLVFETAFFVELPARERYYALDFDVAEKLHVRRYGFHGLFHEAACREVTQLIRAASSGRVPRILSVCLEPQPEVTAVKGGHPLMVSSGITPLEGLPGQTTCGELDPSIILTLAKEKGLGPEEINQILTKKSGIYGVLGEHTSLGKLLTTVDPKYQLAQQMIRYRILRAAGEAIAAMGGLDVIAYSGRFTNAGKSLHAWLLAQRLFVANAHLRNVTRFRFEDSLEQVVAETAASAFVSQAAPNRDTDQERPTRDTGDSVHGRPERYGEQRIPAEVSKHGAWVALPPRDRASTPARRGGQS
ncbi:MAG: hypothetical protein HQ559_01570 [Lentisphaerae bacterium]|nr:hypothetical protein [Lentisphaerota bacterium]